MAMGFGEGRRGASRQYWDTLNRNKMANPDSQWDSIVDPLSARAQALGLAPIRPTAQSEAAQDAARLRRAREYYRTPGPLDFANTSKLAPYAAPENGGGGYTKANPPRMQPGSNVFSPGSGDYEALLTRARNGYYLNDSERQALVGRFGNQLNELLTPAEGAKMRPREWQQRTDRLKMMAALGMPNLGPVAAAAAPGAGSVAGAGMPTGPRMGAPMAGPATVPVGAGGSPSIMDQGDGQQVNPSPRGPMTAAQAVAALGGGGMQGGNVTGMAPPAASQQSYATPGAVASPGYQQMGQAAPLNTMLSGKDYIQNRAQQNRLARGYRRSGVDPRMAALLAREEQEAGRGFMAGSELMNRNQANQANAVAMGYNSDVYGTAATENASLGEIGLRDQTRRDMREQMQGDNQFRDREYGDRQRRMDALLGGEGKAALSPEDRKFMAMDMMNPGSGEAASRRESDRARLQAEREAAILGGSNGDPTVAERYKRLFGQNGGASAGGGEAPSMMPLSPPKDASGAPVVDGNYIDQVLKAIPNGATQDQIDKVLSESGVTMDDISREYGSTGEWMDREYTSQASWMNPLNWGGKLYGALTNPSDSRQIKAMADLERQRRRRMMGILQGGSQAGGLPAYTLPSSTVPSFTPR